MITFKGSNTAVCLSQSTYDSMYTGFYSELSNDLLTYMG